MGALDELDLSLRLSREEEAERLEAAQHRLLAVRLRLGGLIGDGLGPPLCVLLEGWDASGKGGAIKRLVAPLDPRHVRVKQFAAPTPDEKRHHWLAALLARAAGLGRHGRARPLVVRARAGRARRGLRPDEAWHRAYEEIRDFEHRLVAEGMVLVKLWLHISDDEQLKRFKAREQDPLKSWKLTDEDWRNREKRPQYEQAVEDMVRETSTGFAPWTLVEADSQALRAREGDRDGDRRRRGRHAPPRHDGRPSGSSGGRPSGPCRGRGPSPWPRACACAGPPRAGAGRAGAPSAASAWRRAR